MKDTAARTKILEATINSIETYGIEGCTIRNIAKEANVTLSSIHYYLSQKMSLSKKRSIWLQVIHLKMRKNAWNKIAAT